MKISIITPCRNSENTIERTIQSVVSQAVGEHELEYIIVDGVSTDSTLDIIKDYADKYPFIKYISEKDNSMTEALNKGMRMATGDIVASINADDTYLPDTLIKVIEEYQSKKSDILIINTYIIRDGGYVKSHNTPRYFSPFICSLIECPFPECAIFFRRECVVDLGYFNEEYKYTQDLELYLRQYEAGYSFRYANIDGSCFFVSDTNYSSVIGDKMCEEVCRYIKRKWLYRYIARSQFSKLLKCILRSRHYYVFKKFTYEDILKERA